MRWQLTAAYLLLVAVTAFSAWESTRTADRIERDLCEVVALNLLVQVNILEAVGADRDVIDAAVEVLADIGDCG